MSVLSIDFETRSAIDLPKTGVYRYAEDESTDIWCMAWAFDDEDPQIWIPGNTLPKIVRKHIEQGGEIRAWNAQFERVIWNHIMVPRYGAPEVQMHQWVCSAVEASALALPRSLDAAAKALGTDAKKDKDGYNLMMRMARPRKVLPSGEIIWWDEPEMRAKLEDYCRQDVRTERDIVKRLVRLTPLERELYLLDQRMNDRGVRVDLDLVRASQTIAMEGVARANQVLVVATGGAVPKVTNHAKLKAWLNERGVQLNDAALESTDRATVDALLKQDLPADVKAALVARSEAGRSSVAKLQTMQDAAGMLDDRLRGMFLFNGASTGRWSAKLVQPHNFPRGTVENVERFIPIIEGGDYERIDMEYPPVEVISSLLRGMLVPSEGHTFMAGDYSAIEARVLNWIAGQDDMVALFQAYDAATDKKEKERLDPYRRNAARLYNIDIDAVQKFPHRQTGKFQELGCGFGMGKKKAVITAADVYGLTITLEQSAEIVGNYRETHPEVTGFWRAAENACKDAIRTPGVPMRFGAGDRLFAAKVGGYLFIKLPSGRALAYPAPRIVSVDAPWDVEAHLAWMERRHQWQQETDAAGMSNEPFPEVEPEIHQVENIEFSAVLKNNAWGRERTYGGKLTENIVQAIARDLMAEAMLRGEQRGFLPVMTVHDEIVTEGESTDTAAFAAVMAEIPAWAEGCPVGVDVWAHTRYRK